MQPKVSWQLLVAVFTGCFYLVSNLLSEDSFVNLIPNVLKIKCQCVLDFSENRHMKVDMRNGSKRAKLGPHRFCQLSAGFPLPSPF